MSSVVCGSLADNKREVELRKMICLTVGGMIRVVSFIFSRKVTLELFK